MFNKIKTWIESRKVTKLSTFADRACDYDYDLGYDPEYGDIGWYEPKDDSRERTASEQEAVDAAEKRDHDKWIAENEERWEDTPPTSEMALQMTLFPNKPAWA